MASETETEPLSANRATTRGEELRAFLLFTVILAPLMAVVCVGGYGFILWMSHLVYGPPTG